MTAAACVGPQPRERRLCRLAHDVSLVSGQGQHPGAGHPARFDHTDRAAARRAAAQPERDARPRRAAGDLPAGRLGRAEHAGEGGPA